LRAVGADAARAAPLNLRESPNPKPLRLAAGTRGSGDDIVDPINRIHQLQDVARERRSPR